MTFPIISYIFFFAEPHLLSKYIQFLFNKILNYIVNTIKTFKIFILRIEQRIIFYYSTILTSILYSFYLK